MNNRIDRLYQELMYLLKSKNDSFIEKSVSIFGAVKGKCYRKNGIMIIGRAVNGWGNIINNCRSFNEELVLRQIEIDRGIENLDWVE